jgi:prepilin-type N-terminal cleavage/methylation domain-containing protein/prepilin-type processing-associated H-X9-DG protein
MKADCRAFTLIELLVVITIVGILAALAAPNFGTVRAKAESAKCANNLRNIGIAVSNYSQDNDNRFPTIESMPSDPVYAEGANGEKPGTMLDVLGSYGVSTAVLQCPTDLRTHNYFKKEGSSYQWRNIVDDEIASAPKLYGRRGVRNPKATWLLLVTDYEAVHRGRANRLYADGHIKSY